MRDLKAALKEGEEVHGAPHPRALEVEEDGRVVSKALGRDLIVTRASGFLLKRL